MAIRDLADNILACITIPVYVFDLEKNLIFLNKMAERITGCMAAEVVGAKKCFEVMGDPEVKCQHDCPAHTALEGGPPKKFDKLLRTLGGKTERFRASAGPLFSGGEMIGVIVTLDEYVQQAACNGSFQAESGAGADEHCLMEKALRESQEKYRHLLENIEDGYYEVDLAGNLLYCNDALARICGITDKISTLGMNYRDYMDKENAAAVFQVYSRVYNTGTPEKGFILEIKRPDGARRTLEVSVSLIRDDGGKNAGFRGIARDITVRRQAEEKLRYFSMHDIMTGLYNRAYFEEEMIRLNRSRFSPVTIISFDVDGLKIVNDAFGHKKGDMLLKSVARVLKDPFRSSDVVARIGGDEFAIILPKTNEETAMAICERIRQSIDSHNAGEAGLPISLSIGKATGNISRELTCEELFRRADNEIYRQKLKNKSDFTKSVLKYLSASLEEKDYMAGGHAERISGMAKKTGEAAGLSSRELSELRLLAQYHDVGMVGLPDAILFKTRPLNKKEWDEIKQHSETGYRIAKSLPELSPIADLILHHHEWWNGKGYPLGLIGEEIPVLCRLFAIVDAYDAMISQRPYRKPLGRDEARSEIGRFSGSQFDPELAKVFLNAVDD